MRFSLSPRAGELLIGATLLLVTMLAFMQAVRAHCAVSEQVSAARTIQVAPANISPTTAKAI
ncbi:MAG: hypothetical protein ABWZ80_09540 [Beijerinckiaceae bacterium]